MSQQSLFDLNPFTYSQDEIAEARNLVEAQYLCGYLCDETLLYVPDANLQTLYLMVYREVMHEMPGTFRKAADTPNRLVAVFELPIDHGLYEPDRPYGLWVQDDDALMTLDRFIVHYFQDLRPEGFSLDISPLAKFSGMRGTVYARNLMLDLQTSPSNWSEVHEALTSRIKADEGRYPFPNEGFFAESSDGGLHLYGLEYVSLQDRKALVSVGAGYGTALLLNHEGEPQIVDDRSVGHSLRSLSEGWVTLPPIGRRTEIGCLRILRSTLKPHQPSFIGFVGFTE